MALREGERLGNCNCLSECSYSCVDSDKLDSAGSRYGGSAVIDHWLKASMEAKGRISLADGIINEGASSAQLVFVGETCWIKLIVLKELIVLVEHCTELD